MKSLIDTFADWFSGMRDTDRRRAFAGSDLWIGLPIAAAVAFAIIYMPMLLCDREAAMRLAVMSASLASFSWILGIWASTASDDTQETEQSEEVRLTLRDKLTGLLAALLVIAAICYPDIKRVVTDGKPLYIGVTGIAIKVISILAVSIPIAIGIKRR